MILSVCPERWPLLPVASFGAILALRIVHTFLLVLHLSRIFTTVTGMLFILYKAILKLLLQKDLHKKHETPLNI